MARERKVQHVDVPAQDVDAALRRLFPDLMKNQPPPAADAPPIPLALNINPAKFALDLQPIVQKLGKRPGLSSLSPIESFLVFLKVWVALALWS